MRKAVFMIALVLLLVLSSPADAVLMAIWDFGPNAAGYTLDVTSKNVIGIPTLIASGADYDVDGENGVAYTDAAGNPHIAGQSVRWGDVSVLASDAYWIMTINTAGWEDMAIRWDYFSDATGGKQGPTSFDIGYKVADGNWIEILNDVSITRDDNWHEFSLDLSSIAAIENQTIVQFRVNDLNRADDNGDYKFDNLELTGVPEPATLVSLGIGSAMMTLTRKGKLV